MSCAYRIGVSLLFLTGIVVGQTTSPGDQETIWALVQQVKELQGKVAALESKQNPSSNPATDVKTEVANDRNDEPSQNQASLLEAHEIRGVQWRGFGEINYKVLNQRQPELGTFGFVPGSSGNFYTGDFDLFLTSSITEKASVLAEVVIGEGDAAEL